AHHRRAAQADRTRAAVSSELVAHGNDADRQTQLVRQGSRNDQRIAGAGRAGPLGEPELRASATSPGPGDRVGQPALTRVSAAQSGVDILQVILGTPPFRIGITYAACALSRRPQRAPTALG